MPFNYAPVRGTYTGVRPYRFYRLLFNNLGYLTRTNGTATLADSEAQVLVQSDVGDKLDGDRQVVARGRVMVPVTSVVRK